jgi:hypothetical protein
VKIGESTPAVKFSASEIQSSALLEPKSAARDAHIRPTSVGRRGLVPSKVRKLTLWRVRWAARIRRGQIEAIP